MICVCVCVCACVWHVCVFWCLCNNWGRGGDQRVNMNGKHFLPCLPTLDLTNIIKTILLFFLNTSAYIHSAVCIWRTCSGELHQFFFFLCNLSIHSSAGKWSWTYFIFSLTSKHEHTRGCSSPCLLLVYTLIAVHLTLAQRVLHPSLTLNVDVRIILCTHVKKKTKSSVFQIKKNYSKIVLCFPALPRYLEWFKLFLAFMVLLMEP